MHVESPKTSFSPSRPNDTEPSEEQANFANKDITILPNELLVKIFSNLDTRDLVNCQLVNRCWQELIDDHMLALAYYRRCHRAKQPINPLTVERYRSSIRGWLRGFSDLGRESAARLDRFWQHKHFTEILFFSIAKVLAKAKALTYQNVGTIKHSSGLGEPSFSPDGNYLVTVSHRRVKISELVAGRWQEKVTIRHLCPVIKVRFSPDGKRLVTASYDQTAKICELEGGQWQEKITLQHSDWVGDAFFSLDGRHLVTISDTARTWELEGGQWQAKAILRHSLHCHVEKVYFSPDGNHLVTKAFQDRTPKIWGLIAGQWGEAEIECYEHGYEGAATLFSSWVNDVCFSPDGNYLVIANVDTSTIWKFVDGKWKKSAALKHNGGVTYVRFSPDGSHLLTVARGRPPQIWGAVDDQWQEKATIRHSGLLSIIRFSPDGSHLVTASDRTAKIWGLVDDDWQEKIIIQHSSAVRGVSFNPDGKHLVLISCDDTDKIWGVVDGQWQPKGNIGPFDLGMARNTSFSPDGYHFVTTSDYIAEICVLKSKENDDSC